MITRIVRLSFQPDKLTEFHAIFEANKARIRAFEGCHHLELHQDAKEPNVRYTFSIWESEDALNAYRYSDVFRATWSRTKLLFDEKPQAFSLQKLQTV